jgi:hypothetical protein
MLIIICGLPGSGKSTLARALSRALNADHLGSDLIRKEQFPSPTYSEDEKRAVYAEMEKRAGIALAQGKNAVVDATFYKKWQREAFVSLAHDAGVKSAIVRCYLEESQTRKRLGRRRPGNVSDADYSIYLKLKGEFEPVGGGHLELDSKLPLKERVRRVLDFLG